MLQLISIGTSVSKGLGLHLYNRDTITNDGIIDMNVTDVEYQFNLKNSYSGILADTLGYELKHIDTGYNHSFFNQIDLLLQSIETDTFTKIIVLQLSNLHRDFFIYDNKSYSLDFESYEGFLKSKKELIKDKDSHFIKELEDDLELFILDEHVWRSRQIIKMIKKIEELRIKLKKYNIIFKILIYFDDWDIAYDYFCKNDLLIRIHMSENIHYSLLYDFVKNEKLRIIDDLPNCTDGHPNFEAHKIIANQLYDNIKIEPLYKII
jgi:hypothetical protein